MPSPPPAAAQQPAGSSQDGLFYAQLGSDDRARISAVCTAVEQAIAGGGVPQLERLVLDVEPPLQLALLEQLLPVEIDYLVQTRGTIPTLHELSVQLPNLETLLPLAYARLNPEVRLPDVLGMYRLVRVIGSGSQATIAIGRHKRLQQLVAIKFSREQESSRRLLQEAMFLSRLEGLPVPRVIDDGRAPDGTAYFIMEYLEGQNLFDRVQDRGPLPDPRACLRCLLQITQTAAAMHERGILHRDLTPRNIHVGDDGVVRIVDFGLAMDASNGPLSRGVLHEFHGTPAFMAPEQLDRQGEVDGRLSDIYALGRLLLFIAQGLDAILATTATSADATRSAPGPGPLPDRSLQKIYLKATALQPGDRYPTAEALAVDLQRALRSLDARRLRNRLGKLGAAGLLLGAGAWAAGHLLPGRETSVVEDQGETATARPDAGPVAVLPAVPRAPENPARSIQLAEGVDLEFVELPAGEFLMGSPASDIMADPDELPQHPVRITRPFWLGRTEVTVAQFGAFVEATRYQTDAERLGAATTNLTRKLAELAGHPLTTWREPGLPQGPDHPVVNVSWNDAVRFCDWLSQQHHRQYRLPTEAEWEYACRAGSTTRYHFGDDFQLLPQQAAVAPLAPGAERQFTRPVRLFAPNAWGLSGLHGNVAEWCQDWYSASAYTPSSATDPQGPASSEFRVRRGGAYNLPPEDCRSADRNGGKAAGPHEFVGFRVVDAGPPSLAGRWNIVQGSAFLWSSPVTLNADGTSSLGLGKWTYRWNGSDRFELRDAAGQRPSAFGGRDSDFIWEARLSGNRLELSQAGTLKIVLEKIGDAAEQKSGAQ